MARYIDADELIKQMKDGKYVDKETSFQRGVNSAIDYWITEINHFPSADVVPKGVLDQVRWERRVAIKQLEEIGLSFGEKTEGYGNLTEYAREIFEEIEDVINNIGYFDEIDFKALKKKYTKGEHDEQI